MKARIEYTKDTRPRRRLLKYVHGIAGGWLNGNRYEATFDYNAAFPHVAFVWWCGIVEPGQPLPAARRVRLAVFPTHGGSIGAHVYGGYEERFTNRGHGFDVPFPGDPARWVEFLSLARCVAAGQSDALCLLGFIEDHMPEPWCALATDNPIRLFAALCPVPLAANPEG